VPENFFREDIRVGEERHLVLASDGQLELLKKAKLWFLDGTFASVRKPFHQLFSVHGFVSCDDDLGCIKQVPSYLSEGVLVSLGTGSLQEGKRIHVCLLCVVINFIIIFFSSRSMV
jgi:hypothetical protein